MASVYSRYANALSEGLKRDQLGGILSDLINLEQAFSNSKLYQFLKTPILSSSKKFKFIDEKIEISEIKIKKLLRSLILRGHSENLEEALKKIISDVEKKCGIEEAFVETSFSLDANEADSIRSTLSRVLDKTIRINVRVNKNLIAGFKIQVGGKLFDNSVSSQISKIKDRLDQVGRYEH